MILRTKLTLALCLALSLGRIECFGGSILGANIDINEHSELIVDVRLSNYVPVAEAGHVLSLYNYILLDIDSGRFLPIMGVRLKQCSNNLQLLLDPTLRISTTAHLHLFIKALALLDDEKPGTLDKTVAPPQKNMVPPSREGAQEKVCTPPPPAAAAKGQEGRITDKGSEHLLTAAKGKDDSDIYLSGQANGASSQKFSYTADVKLAFPFKTLAFSRVNTIAPLFTYNASTDPKANPDTLNLGVDWSLFPVRDLSPSPFTRLMLTNSPKLEGNHDLEALNFIHGVRFTFLSRVARTGVATLYALPYAGQEVGVTVASPFDAAEGNFIARPNAGATAGVVFDVNRTLLKNVTIESSGGRRWLLRNEVAVDTDKTGKTIAVNSNTKPKDYVKTSLTFNITDYWGITLSHEYGRLPPLYKLVDNKMTVGLTYKAVLNRKAILQ